MVHGPRSMQTILPLPHPEQGFESHVSLPRTKSSTSAVWVVGGYKMPRMLFVCPHICSGMTERVGQHRVGQSFHRLLLIAAIT